METRVIFHYKTYFFLTYNITIILQNTFNYDSEIWSNKTGLNIQAGWQG